jgi:hypothetical protein
MSSRRNGSEGSEPGMTESEYDDLVWLTKKAARAKLEKWRRSDQKPEVEGSEGADEEVTKTCRTCYFCSYLKEVNKILYVRCTVDEPRWVASQNNLHCWRAK